MGKDPLNDGRVLNGDEELHPSGTAKLTNALRPITGLLRRLGAAMIVGSSGRAPWPS
jgi:hypothetical protein